MGPHRVAVIDDGSLLIAAAMSVLEPTDGYELRRIKESGGDPAAALTAYAPDVIVATHAQANNDGVVSLEGLLRACPEARVVVLSPDQPMFEVYRERRVESATLDGFLDALKPAQP